MHAAVWLNREADRGGIAGARMGISLSSPINSPIPPCLDSDEILADGGGTVVRFPAENLSLSS